MRSTVVTAIFLTLGLGVVDTAFGGTITPVYTSTYGDAITGDNFTGDGFYVDAGADNYGADEYERPTTQSEYFGYLDITGADFGSDYKYMYFGIDVYSQNSITSDGSVSGAFGSGTLYGVRMGGYLLRVKGDDSGLYGNTWVTGSNQGFWDANGAGSVDGFETEVITDGAASGGEPVLFARIIFNPDGSARIELAFDYETWNQLYPDQHLDPAYLQYVVFEANRGMKDNTKYFWNDNYSESDIYEVDTLTAYIHGVPEPTTLSLLAAGLLAGAVFRKRFHLR